MPETYEYKGLAFICENLEEKNVRIVVENGIITSIEEINSEIRQLICPSFFNAHTHIGDTIAMDIQAKGTLAELVAPPDGLKHRLLSAAPRDKLIAGMRRSVSQMENSGTAAFADFREGGRDGVNSLNEAMRGLASHAVILGRNGGEEIADGFGISSAGECMDIEEKVANAREKGKLVAFHAGEKDPDDVDEALAYDPDLLVHCTHATDTQLKMCVDMDIPIAVCPRSNWALGVSESAKYPPVKKMLEMGCTLLLGTDNVMFIQPDMFQEMSFTHQVYGIEPKEMLKMAIKGSSVFGMSHFIKEGHFANFFIIDIMRGNMRYSYNFYKTTVNRVNESYIKKTVLNYDLKNNMCIF